MLAALLTFSKLFPAYFKFYIVIRAFSFNYLWIFAIVLY